MVTPSVAASTSPIRLKTASRSPCTLKPVLLSWAAGRGAVAERVTDRGASAGSAIAPEVSGRSRSGGTSSGRFSGLCAYRSLPLRNQLQPAVPSTATASAAATRKRNGGAERCIWISCGSGGECIAARGDCSWREASRGLARGAASAGVGGGDRSCLAPGDRVRHPGGQRGVLRGQRRQRQAQAMADALAGQQRLDRDGV